MEDPLIGSAFVLILFVFLHSIFISAEIAYMSIYDSNVDFDELDNNLYDRMLKKFSLSPNTFITTIQLSTMITSIFANLYLAFNISTKFVNKLVIKFSNLNYNTTFVIITVLLGLFLTIIILLFGVYIPKKIPNTYHKKFSRFSFFIVFCFYIIFYPIVSLILKLLEIVSKILGVSINTQKTITEKEILMMMDIGAEKGTIQNEEKTMVENIFEFNNQTAEDIMTHRTGMHAININDTNDVIISIIKESGYSRFPVYDEDIDNIIGVLNARKFFLNLHSYPQKAIRDIMYEPYLVPATIQADILFRTMQKNKTHLAIVVDEYGGISGLVTMEDLLEEIVGNIYDENDNFDEQEIIRLQKNLWKIMGTCKIDMINEALDIDIQSSNEFDTLGGMIFNSISLIPEDGKRFEIDINNLHIQVLKVEDHRIIKALVSKVENEKNDY